MAASAKMPPHALRLATYAELEAYVRAFAAGHLPLLMLIGPPGVGKSRCLRQALDSRAGWLSGQATPLGIYLQAYEHRNQPLVLDDVDGLYADRSGIRFLCVKVSRSRPWAGTPPRRSWSCSTCRTGSPPPAR